ncbi:MAG: YgcG family protein [Spirochaetales bacterium]|nr:YgcG family protein [Spirochaetales bacterium]
MNRFSFTVFALGLNLALLAQEVEIPPLQRRVTDLTSTLSSGQVEQIEARLKALEDSKGSQIAVLLVPTTQPEAIEQYSIRVAEKWKLGRKGVDDGVLFLIAIQDRAMRIEVGYGLEGALTDALTKRIIAEVITPYFRAEDYNGGINAGVDAMIAVINGEELPAPTDKESGSSSGISETFLNILVAVGLVGGLILRGLLGRLLGSTVMGLGVFLVSLIFLSFLQAALAGFIVFIIVLLAGVGGGSGGSWSSGSGGFSSGGFSGGGGSFGGGGSSGRW